MDRLHVAEEVVRRFPRTLTSWRTGAGTQGHLRALVAEAAGLADSTARQVDEHLADRLGRLAHGRWVREVRRAVATADPGLLERRRASAAERRRIDLREEGDGSTTLAASGPSATVHAVYGALDALAGRCRDTGDSRTLAQRRFDALAALVELPPALTGATTERAADRLRRRPLLQVTVGLDTLLGLGDAPGETDTGVAVTAQAVRELAEVSVLRRLVLDPLTGALLDISPDRRPTARLHRAVLARDPRCGHPTCAAGPGHRDFEHTVARQDGGATSAANGGGDCRGHNNLKELPGWRVTPPTATEPMSWVTPTGRRYRVEPHDLRPPGLPPPEPPF